MLALLTDPQVWASLVTLTVLEIVLGIDNIVFISILVGRLDERQARRARKIGLTLALVFRILMLITLAWLIGLAEPFITILGEPISWRDVILLSGGLFLLVKATREIHQDIEREPETLTQTRSGAFAAIIAQIIVIDLVFSVDSIITAIGMARHVEVMVAAVTIAMAVMYVASGPIAAFIKRNPTTKMLALAFLLLIGVALIADGLGFHIPRGYIYFSMAFAAMVEAFNVLARRRRVSEPAD